MPVFTDPGKRSGSRDELFFRMIVGHTLVFIASGCAQTEMNTVTGEICAFESLGQLMCEQEFAVGVNHEHV